jgi:hypothetical protein
MRGTLAALTMAAALAVSACGDDGDSSDDAGDDVASTTTQADVPAGDTSVPEGSSAPAAAGDVDAFCNDYQAAQASAQNPASTEQFEDLTPPEELADIWQDYLDSDWDAGTTVDGFVADNCFDE